MITAITFSTILIILFALVEAADDAQDIRNRVTIWHGLAWLMRASVAIIFSVLAHSYNLNPIKILVMTFYQGGLFGIVFTTIFNRLQGRHIFEIGTTTGSQFDRAFNKMFGNQSAGIMECVFFLLVSGLSLTYYILK